MNYSRLSLVKNMSFQELLEHAFFAGRLVSIKALKGLILYMTDVDRHTWSLVDVWVECG